MAQPSRIRKYVHKKNKNVCLFIGYDNTRRLISRVERDGQVIQRDMYIHLPNPQKLEALGWTLAQ